MGLKIAICQLHSLPNEVDVNLNKILSTINQVVADLYIFPELFLTGYGANYIALEKDVQYALDKIRLRCMEKEIAVAIGTPSYDPDGLKNSLLFITQNNITRYDKLYLAKFGIYSEDEFISGLKPVLVTYKGMIFGLSICYDLFFPEIYRRYAFADVDVNICVAASAEPSKKYFEKVLPARSLENVTYTIYVNNIGEMNDNKFYGTSRLISPLGDTLDTLNNEESVLCVYVDKVVINNARKERRHLKDFRDDIDWNL